MKSFALIAAAVLAASGALAQSAGSQPSTSGAAVVINGTSTQTASLVNTSVTNESFGDSFALQNLASNSGQITINGSSSQMVDGDGSQFINTAAADGAIALQNVSSNLGNVTINGSSSQTTTAFNAFVVNVAQDRGSLAVQNIASNNGCANCDGIVSAGRKGGW